MTDLWIVGLGIQTVNQITREVEQAFRASREILYLDTGVATKRYLEGLCPRVSSLFEQSYGEDRPRLSAYEHMAIRVLEAALDHPPVTFAIHGHPLIARYTRPFWCWKWRRRSICGLKSSPASLPSTRFSPHLRIDPVVHGVQMFEATGLLLRRRPLHNDVPAIIWQVGTLDTGLHSQRVSRPERFARFIAHLQQYYPAEHQVVAIYGPPTPFCLRPSCDLLLRIWGLYAGELHAGFTLYIPPAIGRPVQDWDLLAKLYSVDHLRSLTR